MKALDPLESPGLKLLCWFTEDDCLSGAGDVCDVDDRFDLHRSIKMLVAGKQEQIKPILSSINLITTDIRQPDHAACFQNIDNSHGNALPDKFRSVVFCFYEPDDRPEAETCYARGNPSSTEQRSNLDLFP